MFVMTARNGCGAVDQQCASAAAVPSGLLEQQELCPLGICLPFLLVYLNLIILAQLQHFHSAFSHQGHDVGGASPQLTVFHGLRAPPISIEAYLVRIAKYAKCSPACFAHSMVHMLKLAQQDTSFAPTRLNVHRLVLTGVLISAKFLDDRYFNNAFYAKVRLPEQTVVVSWLFSCPLLPAASLCWCHAHQHSWYDCVHCDSWAAMNGGWGSTSDGM